MHRKRPGDSRQFIHTYQDSPARVATPGSSPHTWGIRPGAARARPARGGGAPQHGGGRAGGGCPPPPAGAYGRPRRFPARPFGSSPHTWGIPGWGNYPPDQRRFIPTYVGHTDLYLCCIQIYSVHPHIRGAYAAGRCLPTCNTRFIPTYVGHTLHCLADKDHHYGSSPHTWGIRRLGRSSCGRIRFIPTYVGHTINTVVTCACSCGSSPHTWGIPIRWLTLFDLVRFIPTYVGHTRYR